MREAAEPTITAPVKETRYTRASEMGSFVFCKRSWRLGRQDAPSLLEPERARGTLFHEQHGARVQAAARTGRLATWCAIAAAILLALGMWLVLR